MITHRNPAINTGINGIANKILDIMAINNNIYMGLPEYSIIFRLLLKIFKLSLVLLLFIILFILDNSGQTEIPALFIMVFNPDSCTQLGVFESVLYKSLLILFNSVHS
jgi:hypothetical protein